MIGKKLKMLLKQSGKRQIDLARHLGISASRLSNYLSDKREPDFQMLSEMAYFLGVDLNYFSNKNFKKKRKNDIVERTDDSYIYDNETESIINVAISPVNGKKKGITTNTIPISSVFLSDIKNPEENVTVYEVNSEVPDFIAGNNDYFICVKCSAISLNNGDMIFENGRNMKFYHFYKEDDFIILINMENNKEHLKVTSIHDLDDFHKVLWLMKKYY